MRIQFLGKVALSALLISPLFPTSAVAQTEAPTKVVGFNEQVFNLPVEEADAFIYLYRNMTLGDQENYTPDYYLKVIRKSLDAKKANQFATTEPEAIWLEYVLSPRVADEGLDNFRSYYFDDLQEATANKDRAGAIAAVKNWVAQNVDIDEDATAGLTPMNVVRCNVARPREAAITLVTAYRTVGIPARLTGNYVEVYNGGNWEKQALSPTPKDKKNRSRLMHYGEKLCEVNDAELATRYGEDSAPRVAAMLKRARGNWQAITDFLDAVPRERLQEAISMAEMLSDLSLQSTPARILTNTVNFTTQQPVDEIYLKYVLNPEIGNIPVTDYRRRMRLKHATSNQSVDNIKAYIRDRVEIVADASRFPEPVYPTQLWKQRRGDKKSVNIYFVAACRNNGIPARLDANGSAEYYEGGSWHNAGL